MYWLRTHLGMALMVLVSLALVPSCTHNPTTIGSSGLSGPGGVSGPTLGPGGTGPTISNVKAVITQKFKEIYGGNCGAGGQYPTKVTVTFTNTPVIAHSVQAPVGNTQVTQTVWPVQTVVDVHMYSPYPPNIAQLEGTPNCNNSHVTRGEPGDVGGDTFCFTKDSFGNFSFYTDDSTCGA